LGPYSVSVPELDNRTETRLESKGQEYQKKRFNMRTLERAIVIATEDHAGVKDKGGAPHILHPLRMLLALSSDDGRATGRR
jgi:hypothetical protein